jgi:hypothetical protein
MISTSLGVSSSKVSVQILFQHPFERFFRGSPGSDLRQYHCALYAVSIGLDRGSSAFPIGALSNNRRDALGADAANRSPMAKLKPASAFDALDQHRPLELASQIAVAWAADATQR